MKGKCSTCGKEGEVRQDVDTVPPMCYDCYYAKRAEMAERVGWKEGDRPPYRCTTWYREILGPGETREDVADKFFENKRGWPMGGTTFAFDMVTGWWIVKYWVDSSD